MTFDLTKDNREIETEYLKIYGNCLEFKDTIIQLSNISLVSIGDIAATKFPIWTVFVILMGLLFCLSKSGVGIILGVSFIAVGAGALYLWYQEVERTKEIKKLLIATNSGNVFTIVFNNRKFLEKVIKVLKNIIAYPERTNDLIINIKDNTFSGDAKVIQEINETHL